MKYFVLLLFVLLIVAALFFFVALWRCTQKRLYCSVFAKKIGGYYGVYAGLPFFPNYLAQKAADIVLQAPAKQQKQLFKAVYAQKIPLLTAFLKDKNPITAAAVGRLPCRRKKIYRPSDKVLALIITNLLAVSASDYKKLRINLRRLSVLRQTKAEEAWQAYFNAKISLYAGDMYAASRHAVEAACLFKKVRHFPEEALSYTLLGDIYRFCAIYDVAQMMYDSAAEIYRLSDIKAGEAEVLACKGMLWMSRERFAEATELFCRSRRVFKKLKLMFKEAETINQLALLNLMRKRFKPALKYAVVAAEKHRIADNIQGWAYSQEILALISAQQADYTAAADYARQAQKGYAEAKNHPAYMDAAFLEAEALFNLDDCPAAADCCCRIIKYAARRRTSFRMAKVYTLLGLIDNRLQDFKSARVMFKRSLAWEQKNGQCAAAATDYINLAQVETNCGNLSAAKKYLDLAATTVQKYGDEQLCAVIQTQMEKINLTAHIK